jgi:hypothetical protein
MTPKQTHHAAALAALSELTKRGYGAVSATAKLWNLTSPNGPRFTLEIHGSRWSAARR